MSSVSASLKDCQDEIQSSWFDGPRSASSPHGHDALSLCTTSGQPVSLHNDAAGRDLWRVWPRSAARSLPCRWPMPPHRHILQPPHGLGSRDGLVLGWQDVIAMARRCDSMPESTCWLCVAGATLSTWRIWRNARMYWLRALATVLTCLTIRGWPYIPSDLSWWTIPSCSSGQCGSYTDICCLV